MILDIFVGAPQSKYAALAILSVIFVVSMTILLGKNHLPLSQKFAFILLIFLVSVPSILLTLFQLTCMVTGAGFKNKRWWCSLYAWIISILIVLYCIVLIVSAILSLVSGASALDDVKKSDKEKFALREHFANQMAEVATSKADDGSVPPVKSPFANGPIVSNPSLPSPLVLDTSSSSNMPASKAQGTAQVQPMPKKIEKFEDPQEPEAFNDFGGYASVEGFKNVNVGTGANRDIHH